MFWLLVVDIAFWIAGVGAGGWQRSSSSVT